MNLILLGPQGAGKGTQAAILTKKYGFRHVSSGEVLRTARSSGTPLGNEVKRYYDAGELVPDDITVRLILSEISQASGGTGVILDGFPRTVAQAEALDEASSRTGDKIDIVVELTAPMSTLKRRLGGRLLCRAAGHDYNVIYRPPKVEGKCDIDGSELYQREDDKPEAIEKRLSIWAEQNGPLVEYYKAHTAFRQVDADRVPEEVAGDIREILEAKGLRSCGDSESSL